MSPRLIIFGLDGATFDVVRPWAEAGHLPTLYALMQRGICGDLESTLPPLTATAWPSFLTGKNPGKHGVFDFFRLTPGELHFVTSQQIDGRWWAEELSDAGLSVALLNVPLTHPPRPIAGYIIPGTPTPDEGHTTFPRDLLLTCECELGTYRISPRVGYEPGNEATFCAALHDLIDLQTRYAMRLMVDRPTEVVMVHFLATDIAQHALWKQHDAAHPRHRAAEAARFGTALCEVFAHIDRAMAEVLGLASAETNVIVISDHGFGPLHRTVNINNFFIERGLLTLKRDRSVRVRAWLFRHDLDLGVPWKIIRRLGLDGRLGKLGRRAFALAQRKLVTFDDVDWGRTVAYSWGHVGQVYINVKGRTPHGCVEPADYEATRRRVIEALEAWRDPITDYPIVDTIISRESVTHGSHLDEGPDLHLIMAGYRTQAYPLFAADGRLFARRVPGDTGSHRRQGILIACGPDVAQARSISNARLIDLAPTILHLLGVPLPADYDGCVLVDLLAESVADRAITYRAATSATAAHNQAPLSDEQNTLIAERLRALGYLS